jgi:hypothetical protein
MSIFDYTEVEMPSDCLFKISPSQIDKFFSYPSVWYKEQILKEPSNFKGNTATTLGTVCHYIYEKVARNEDINRDIVNQALDTVTNPEVNIDEVKELYPLVAASVVNEYLLENIPTKTEFPVVGKVKNGIYVGGTVDAIKGSILTDYKHVATKPNTDQIPFNYKIQLLAYAYALKQNNVFIDRIRLVYGVKPTKTLPARTFVVTEMIGYEEEKLINDTLTLIADTVLYAREHPEAVHLLFKSMGLKV